MVDTSKMVFVFGSNEGGIHGAGAARYAHHERGAVLGCGFGHMTSRSAYPMGSFAIPTKDRSIRNTLPLDIIQRYVDAFITYTAARPDLQFQVTRIGCGLAGLKDSQVAPMFLKCNKFKYPNLWFDNVWMHEFAATGDMSPAGYNIWGTF